MQNLKAEMARKNLTAEKLASLINMPISTFRKKFQGHSEFTIAEARKLRGILGGSIDYLFDNGEQSA